MNYEYWLFEMTPPQVLWQTHGLMCYLTLLGGRVIERERVTELVIFMISLPRGKKEAFEELTRLELRRFQPSFLSSIPDSVKWGKGSGAETTAIAVYRHRTNEDGRL